MSPREKLAAVEMEGQRERRRRQLITAASRIIETEGVEALSLQQVAKVAGCSRALVYQYFSNPEELVQAVVEHYREAVATMFTEEELVGAFSDDPDPDFQRAYVGRILDAFEREGVAGLALANTPGRGRLAQRARSLAREFAQPVVDRLCELGIPETESQLLLELVVATNYRVVAALQAGEISRDSAIDHLIATIDALLGAFLGLARQNA